MNQIEMILENYFPPPLNLKLSENNGFEKVKKADRNLETTTVIDGRFQCYPRYKNAIVPVYSISFSYIESQRLSRTLDYLHEMDGIFWILKQVSRHYFYQLNYKLQREIPQYQFS